MTGPDGIAERTVQSAGWMLARRVGANLTRLVAVAILARHLSPAQFGVVALAQVVLQFITLVGEAGIGTYIVYDTGEGREERAQAAFWLNLVLTVVQCAVCLAVLPLIGRVLPAGQGTQAVHGVQATQAVHGVQATQAGQLTAVLAALVAVFFVRQLAIVPEALLLRDLRHRALARRDIVVDVASAAFSVVLAIRGAGVWSLVIPSLLMEPARLLVATATSRWWPRPPLHVSQWRRILRYTAPLMGSNVLIPVTNDGDTLLVGRLLGATAVGFYSVAWQLANLVGRNVTTVVSSVTMPALAMVRDDADRLRAAYLRMVGFLGVVCLPLLVGMGVLAGDLVPTLYGPRWEPAVALLRIFVVFTLVRSLTSPSSMVYNVTGRPDIGFKFTLWFTPVYLAAIVAGSHWGAVGIATGVMVARTGGAVVDTWLAARQIQLPLRAVVAAVAGSSAVAGTMGLAVWLTRDALARAGVGAPWRLAACTALGGGLYLAGLAVVRPQGSDDLRRSLRSVLAAGGRRLRPVPPEPAPVTARGPA